jgi:hypothetical protein
MARLSNFGLAFHSGDRRESPAEIVALIAHAHNLSTQNLVAGVPPPDYGKVVKKNPKLERKL